MKKFFHLFLVFSFYLPTFFAQAEEVEYKARKAKSAAFVLEHVVDAHDFHIWGEEHFSVALPLPVILRSEKGWHFFWSSAFHHDNEGKVVVENKGVRFVRHHEKIYALQGAENALRFSEEKKVKNAYLPLDFSFTKHVFAMTIAALVIGGLFLLSARGYRHSLVPKGLGSFLEPLILYIRDEIARPNLGANADRFLPYLLTAFFFILFNNLLGLVPFFPGSSNVTGDIAVTFTLASITFIVVHLHANKDYWKHIFAMPGLPVWLLPIMIPIEIVGMFSKPFALMVRLAVNISAGHIIVLSLISLIFTFKNAAWASFSVPFALVMDCLELLVAFLQAYVFTLLSALFIGMATEEHAHEEAH